MGKTEIFGTMGPACAKQEILTEMFRLGMTGIRLNMSHTELEACRDWTEMIKSAAKAAGVRPRLLIDLQGPELRIGELKQPVNLTKGKMVNLSEAGRFSELGNGKLQEESAGGCSMDAAKKQSIPVPGIIFEYLQGGQEILLDDGKIQLKAAEIFSNTAVCEVIRGGMLGSRKSIALPGVRMHLPVLTESDKRNIQNAGAQGVTGIMQPFVRSAEDLRRLREELDYAGASDLEVYAKIENMEGAEHLDELLPYADQIVIARGDLGNSLPLWDLPAVQEAIAGKCRRAEKPFMVVTQMLASMEERSVPTRAEVSDIFRAVQEGASSVMVTGETAVGKYPGEVIRYLSNTVRSAEKYLQFDIMYSS